MPFPASYICVDPSHPRHRDTRILLVYPNCGSDARNISVHLPLSLLHAAALLQDFSVALFDQRIDEPSRYEKLLEQQPACVGFSTMTGPQIKFALGLAEMAKAKGIPTVFGGVHPSLLPEQTQADPRVDYVIAGEGEAAFRELASALAAGRKPAPILRGKAVALDSLPDINYDLVDGEQYIQSAMARGRSLPLIFSRGCPYQCTFCCNPVLSNQNWRHVGIPLLAERVHRLAERFRLEALNFFDENLFASPKTLRELVAALGGKLRWFAQCRANSLLRFEPAFLRESGAQVLSCGLESGSPGILKAIRKEETVEEYIAANRLLAQTDIATWYNYMMGFPGETIEDLQATVQLALRMLDENPHAANNPFYLLSPYPGTKIAQEHLREAMPKNLEGWADFNRHNLAATWHPPERMELYKRIYFSSKFVGRRIVNLFPQDQELRSVAETFTGKWRSFNFADRGEWEPLEEAGWRVLKRLFGEHAY